MWPVAQISHNIGKGARVPGFHVGKALLQLAVQFNAARHSS